MIYSDLGQEGDMRAGTMRVLWGQLRREAAHCHDPSCHGKEECMSQPRRTSLMVKPISDLLDEGVVARTLLHHHGSSLNTFSSRRAQ